MFQSYLSKLFKKKPAEDTLVPPLWGKREKKNVCCSRIICSRCCTRRNLRFHVENCQHADQKQLTRREAFDLDTEINHGQPGSCRANSVNIDDGLEDIRWIRALGGEKLPAASYALLPNLKKGLFFCHRRGIENVVACFLHNSAQMCLYRTPGGRPPPITGRFVNTVTRGWVGAPITSTPRSDFMAQSLVLSIGVCSGLGIPPLRTNIRLSFSQADLGPRSAQEIFFGVFEKFETFFFEDLCS